MAVTNPVAAGVSLLTWVDAANVGAPTVLLSRRRVFGTAPEIFSAVVTTCQAYALRLSALPVTLAKTRSPATKLNVSWLLAFTAAVAVG